MRDKGLPFVVAMSSHVVAHAGTGRMT